ncbi:MAG: hypothetical protein IJ139_07735, partial [Bacteroidaceae bacterium]|nr:hypothetical protein [Bacteroidaceae bacterium]
MTIYELLFIYYLVIVLFPSGWYLPSFGSPFLSSPKGEELHPDGIIPPWGVKRGAFWEIRGGLS